MTQDSNRSGVLARRSTPSGSTARVSGTANGGFRHSWVDRDNNQPWACDSLFSAFENYRWKRDDWNTTEDKLAGYRVTLRQAVDVQDAERVTGTCGDILWWGGVIAHNGAYLQRRGDQFLAELLHMRKILEAQQTPGPSDLRFHSGDASVACRMNAGFVKIYSVWLDYVVIYDGRVGGALGLLVRQFCEQTGRAAVPVPLEFAYGTPKEGANPANPKNRNPSLGPYIFRRLRPDSWFHTEQTMRASWLLREAVNIGAHPFRPGEAGFHELAAALFMVGYDLPAHRV